jgi:hypothetical protein
MMEISVCIKYGLDSMYGDIGGPSFLIDKSLSLLKEKRERERSREQMEIFHFD